MGKQAIALRLLFESMGLPTSIASLNDRKFFQKTVYLLQALGVNFGYRYGWYLKGPYSPDLAQDYYNMPGTESVASYTIKQQLVDTGNRVLKIIRSPDKPDDLEDHDWLELIASVHYLQKVSRLDTDQIKDRMRIEKPHLAERIEIALKVIGEHVVQPGANEAN